MSNAIKAIARLLTQRRELLVSFVLFGFLAWESIGPIQSRMKLDSAKTQVGLLEHAVNTYKETVGSYPPNLDALRVAPTGLPPGKWAGPYLNKDVPLDPWGHPYQYSLPGKQNPDAFDVWTVSPDGQRIGIWNTGSPKEDLDRARTEVGILAESIKKYKETAGSYPPNLRALLVAPEVLPAVKWAGPYLDRERSAPWGGSYRYASPGKHNPDSFDVWTVTPDGLEIGNWIRAKSPAGSGNLPATPH